MSSFALQPPAGSHLEHFDELLGFFMRSVQDPHEAQDLVQETFARLLGRPPADRIENPRALLFEVARNLLIDRHRQRQVRRHESDDLLVGHRAPVSDEPDTVCAARQRLRRVSVAIEQLPPRCREAFVLHKIDGLPQAEVAARMGISRNMVERHVMLGVAACRRALAAAPAGDRDGNG